MQPQNFPRGVIKNTGSAAQVLETGDLEWVRMLYGDPMQVFSSCLRSMIIPTEGKEFVCADYATIEVRVLFWLAGHEDGLKMFREDQDIYIHMAADIYGRSLASILNPSPERSLGKSAVLGCGFGMGHNKFVDTCLAQGQNVSENLGKRAVTAYRETHKKIPEFWRALEQAAINATKRHNQAFKVGHLLWYTSYGFLWCLLPNGRKLAYYNPHLKTEETSWGDPRLVLYHWGVNSLTKKWEPQKTWGGTLAENVTQAVARDLMAEGMLRADDRNYDVVLSAHDELLAEQERGRPLKEFEDLMAEIPNWANGCPVKATGWVGERYRK